MAALDLGGTKLASALVVGDGPPLEQQIAPLAGRGGAAAGQLVIDQVRRLAAAAGQRGLQLHGIGVCVPGIVAASTGRVWAPNIPGWTDYLLRDEIVAVVADAEINVAVGSDRAASILGEAWRGAARGCRHAVFLAVGTGIGAGILCDGRVIDGAHGIAGAIGWWALDRPFRPEYKDRGCFESHASGDGLAKQARAALARRPDYVGPLRAAGEPTAHDLFAAFESGDEIAKEVLGAAIELWGMAAANLVSLLNPEMVIFGGGVFGPATRFLDAVYAEAQRWGQPIAMERVKFAASQLGDQAALFGAAYLAWEE